MDLSKLPKLSQTPAPPADPHPPSAAADDTPPPPPAIAAAMSGRPEWCRKCHAPNASNSRFCASCGAGLGGPSGAAPVEVGAEAWISIAIGVLLLFMARNLFSYMISPTEFGKNNPITDELGNPLPYTRSVFFWGDVALAGFAIVLLFEGIVIAFGRRPRLVLFAFLLTLVATAINVGYFAMMMQKGYGPQLMAGFAAAFGVYIALYQWRLWQSLRTPVL